MKKATITINFDEEKLSALKMYLVQKTTTVEKELSTALEVLYNKNVPVGVREFISLRSGIEVAAERKKRVTPSAVAVVDAETSETP